MQSSVDAFGPGARSAITWQTQFGLRRHCVPLPQSRSNTGSSALTMVHAAHGGSTARSCHGTGGFN